MPRWHQAPAYVALQDQLRRALQQGFQAPVHRPGVPARPTTPGRPRLRAGHQARARTERTVAASPRAAANRKRCVRSSSCLAMVVATRCRTRSNCARHCARTRASGATGAHAAFQQSHERRRRRLREERGMPGRARPGRACCCTGERSRAAACIAPSAVSGCANAYLSSAGALAPRPRTVAPAGRVGGGAAARAAASAHGRAGSARLGQDGCSL